MNTTRISLLQIITSIDGTLNLRRRVILRDLIEGEAVSRLGSDVCPIAALGPAES